MKPSNKSSYTPFKQEYFTNLIYKLFEHFSIFDYFEYKDLTSGLGEWETPDKLEIVRGSPIVVLEAIKALKLENKIHVAFCDEDDRTLDILLENIKKHNQLDIYHELYTKRRACLFRQKIENRAALILESEIKNNSKFKSDVPTIFYYDPGGAVAFNDFATVVNRYENGVGLLHFSSTSVKRVNNSPRASPYYDDVIDYLKTTNKKYHYISRPSNGGFQWSFLYSSNLLPPASLVTGNTPFFRDIFSDLGRKFLTKISLTKEELDKLTAADNFELPNYKEILINV